MREKERANALRWDGSRRSFYEVYYLKFNDAPSQTACWIRFTLTSPKRKDAAAYCELWGIFFDARDASRHFAVKQRYPIERLSWDSHRFRLDLAEAQLSHNACRGEIRDADCGHRLAWDLHFDSDTEALEHFPHARLYSLPFPKTKVLSPHVHARFSGRLEADDRSVELESAPGQQTHIWGSQHAKRWVWGHCNCFEQDPEAVWEGLDSQVALGPLTSPHLKLFFLRIDGRWHRFNAPGQWLRNRSRWELGRWQFEARGETLRISGTVECPLDDLVGVTYSDPDGSPLWCNNTKVASIQLTVLDPAGGVRTRLTSHKGCAVEFVDRRIAPEVPVWI